MFIKISKVKFWLRVGQVSFWLYQLFDAGCQLGFDYETFPVYTAEEEFFSLVCLALALAFSEAIVQLIILFAKGIKDISLYILAEGVSITDHLKDN